MSSPFNWSNRRSSTNSYLEICRYESFLWVGIDIFEWSESRKGSRTRIEHVTPIWTSFKDVKMTFRHEPHHLTVRLIDFVVLPIYPIFTLFTFYILELGFASNIRWWLGDLGTIELDLGYISHLKWVKSVKMASWEYCLKTGQGQIEVRPI